MQHRTADVPSADSGAGVCERSLSAANDGYAMAVQGSSRRFIEFCRFFVRPLQRERAV
jgi:hypothetical protein